MSAAQAPARRDHRLARGVWYLLLALLAARMHHLRPPKPDGFRWIAPAQNYISRYERRFNAVKEYLPAHGRIGYVSDVPAERLMDDFDGSMYFYLTQYALVPLQVVNSTSEPLMIGNFHSPEAARRTLTEGDLSVIHDCRNGVFLLKETTP